MFNSLYEDVSHLPPVEVYFHYPAWVASRSNKGYNYIFQCVKNEKPYIKITLDDRTSAALSMHSSASAVWSIDSQEEKNWHIFDNLYGSREAWREPLCQLQFMIDLKNILCHYYKEIGSEFNSVFIDKKLLGKILNVKNVSGICAEKLKECGYNTEEISVTYIADVEENTFYPTDSEDSDDCRILKFSYNGFNTIVSYSIILEYDEEMDVLGMNNVLVNFPKVLTDLIN